ncbi:MAG: DUF2726 domain-containing protein, partial [Magnetococcales bacterium]|nr:DUF2726 domain-containing protein [Magnetococcales bacterium]
MEWPLLGAVAVLMITIVIVMRSMRKSAKGELLYQKRNGLFFAEEIDFLRTLDQAVGEEYRVFGKALMTDILKVSPEIDGGQRRQAIDRIRTLYADFTLCDPETSSVVCIVLLVDSSRHGKEEEGQVDHFDRVCRQARLPLVSFPVKSSYDVEEVQRKIGFQIQAMQSLLEQDRQRAEGLDDDGFALVHDSDEDESNFAVPQEEEETADSEEKDEDTYEPRREPRWDATADNAPSGDKRPRSIFDRHLGDSEVDDAPGSVDGEDKDDVPTIMPMGEQERIRRPVVTPQAHENEKGQEFGVVYDEEEHKPTISSPPITLMQEAPHVPKTEQPPVPEPITDVPSSQEPLTLKPSQAVE